MPGTYAGCVRICSAGPVPATLSAPAVLATSLQSLLSVNRVEAHPVSAESLLPMPCSPGSPATSCSAGHALVLALGR